MEIRIADENDIDELGIVWGEMHNEIYGHYPDTYLWRSIVRERMKMKTYVMLICKTPVISGLLDFMMYIEPSDGLIHAQAINLYTHPDYRKTSMALRLVRTGIKLAKQSGAKVIEAVWDVKNKQIGDRWIRFGMVPSVIIGKMEV